MAARISCYWLLLLADADALSGRRRAAGHVLSRSQNSPDDQQDDRDDDDDETNETEEHHQRAAGLAIE